MDSHTESISEALSAISTGTDTSTGYSSSSLDSTSTGSIAEDDSGELGRRRSMHKDDFVDLLRSSRQDLIDDDLRCPISMEQIVWSGHCLLDSWA